MRLRKNLPLVNLKTSLLEAAFFGFFTFFFLLVFQPFGTYSYMNANKALLLMAYGGICLIAHFFIRVVVYVWKVAHWSLKKELSVLVSSFFLSCIFSFIYHQQVIAEEPALSHLVSFSLMSFSVSIFPLAAILWNKHEKFKEEKKVGEVQADGYLLLKGMNKEEVYSFNKEEVLFLKVEGNYISVSFMKEGKVQRIMLRNTLKNLRAQLPASFINCHRSFLVQLCRFDKIKRIEGKPMLVGHHHDQKVPVSASYLSDIKKALKDFS